MTDRPVKIKTADGWQDLAIVGPQGPIGSVGPGGLELVYKYTVVGSDKASIDTGVDIADAGTNDWTNGDVLEIYIISRTDSASAGVSILCTFNNDSGANYWRQLMQDVNTSISGAISTGNSALSLDSHGSGGSANIAGIQELKIPNYAGTTFAKTILAKTARPDSTAANAAVILHSWLWNSTSAITRFKVAGNGSDKLKVGTQLLIYKRTTASGTLDGGSP